MKATFLTVLLLTILCNLQHVAFAAEEHAEYHAEEDAGQHAEEHAEEHTEEHAEEHAEEEHAEEVHEADSEEYHKKMEELSAQAEAEHGKIEEFALGEETQDDVIPAPPADPNDPGAKEPDVEEEPHVDDPKANYDEGMAEAEADEEVHPLPKDFPVISLDASHVSEIHAEDEDSVFFTLEYSFFEGADAYEVCKNCNIDQEGKRVGTTGEIEKFSEAGVDLCEVGPSCFNTIATPTGQHDYSMRAHTAAGWTKWSPQATFDLISEIGTVQHHEL